MQGSGEIRVRGVQVLDAQGHPRDRFRTGEDLLVAVTFRTAEPVEHTPFEPDNLGPWQKGKPLGITLGEWFEAGGKGTYSCRDGEGMLKGEGGPELQLRLFGDDGHGTATLAVSL